MSLNPFRQAGKPMPSADTPKITYGPQYPCVVKERDKTRLVQLAPRRYVLERWCRTETKDAMGQVRVAEGWQVQWHYEPPPVAADHPLRHRLLESYSLPPEASLDLIDLLTGYP